MIRHSIKRTELTLSIFVGALAVLGALLLGVGREDYFHVMIIAAAAPLAIYLTDLKRVFRLNRFLANVAALAAVAATTADYFRAQSDLRLLAIANMLVYLQVALFFQEKSRRIWWQIALLSLLQVVVAAALTVSIFFGPLLIVYTGLAVYVLMLLLLEKEIGDLNPSTAGEPVATEASRLQAAGSHPAIQLAAADDISATPAADLARLSTSLLVASMAMLLGVALFFLVPRTGRDPWRGNALSEQHVVGFSQQVRLGEIGQIAEDESVVMRVKFLDPQSGRALQLKTPPRMRGAVVTQYAGGTWLHHRGESYDELERLEPPPLGRKFVLQEITLESLDEPVVFSVYPVYAVDDDLPVRMDVDREQLIREPETLKSSRLTMLLATGGITDAAQAPLTALTVPLPPREARRLTSLPRTRTRELLPDVRAFADNVVAQRVSNSDERYAVCRALERYLKEDGGFTYTLSGLREDESLDPVEDFLLNTRTGHCEYFASALALMLRSQGIPARVVIGYQGGEWNSVGQFYTFRQWHTHSWVEAHLDQQDLADLGVDMDRYPYGAWLQLDPTTGALSASGRQASGMLASLKEATDYAELVWSKYVVGLSRTRQQTFLFAPLWEKVRRLLDPGTLWAELVASPARLLEPVRNWVGGDWVSWRGGVLAMLVAALLAACYRVTLLAAVGLRRLASLGGGRRRDGRMPLYRRFEQVLRRHGIRRKAEQTPRELAEQVALLLAQDVASSSVAGIPQHVVDVFYRVRFGDRFITPAQQRELSAAIVRLDQALTRRKSRGTA